MILLILASNALASGLLWDADDTVPLQALSASLSVDGRIAEASATWTFEDPGPGARAFAALLPEGAAVTGLRYREGEGEWVEAGAVAASAVDVEPGPSGDPRALLEGEVFVAELPELVGGASLQVALDWQSLLAAEAGRLSLVLPLDTGGLGAGDPSASVSFTVVDELVSDPTLSPEGSLEADDTSVEASWSGALSEADALRLSWGVGEPELGVRLWTYRPATDPFTGVEGDAGYALAVIQPGPAAGARVAQIFSFVLDSSASMEGEPLAAAVEAGGLWLDALAEEDRFNLIPYQSQPWPWRARAPLAEAEAVEKGKDYLADQRARGLSDPTEALLEALALGEDTILSRGLFSCDGTARATDTAPPLPDAPVRALDDAPGPAAYVVWLTDGGATTGETDVEAIVAALSDANGLGATIHAIGVGAGADEELLAAVSGANRGATALAEDVDGVAAAVEGLRERTAHPLLVQPTVEIAAGWDQAPAALPDASEGWELLVAFRWDEPGDHTLRLRGVRGPDELDERFEITLPERDESLPAVARAWAQLRVADLDARHLGGETGLYDEIEALVLSYGVASEVVTLGFGGASEDMVGAVYQSAGCGCHLGPRPRAALPLGLLLAALILRRRR